MTAQDIRTQAIQDTPPLTELQQALLITGIKPYYEDDVREYKCQRHAELLDPKSDKDPAYLVTMGIEDLEHEKRLIAGGAA